ncbi:MAG: hypothetical protein U9R42_14140 [Bacteroidota bacterium]|nr:hypothetical protein [Bacteroidota bacterium]
MKKIITTNSIIILSAFPITIIISKLFGMKRTVFELLRIVLVKSQVMLSASLLQTLILLGPILLFFCLTIYATTKEKTKISYLFASLTSISWAFLMLVTLIAYYGE